MIEIVTATNDQKVLENNLVKTTGITSPWYPKLICQRGYNNISEAYNKSGSKADLIIYVHQDVYIPASFGFQLLQGLLSLDGNWGVIGVAGVKLIDGKRENFGNILDRGKSWFFNWDELPAEVDTLDELLLITKGDFVFDENLPLDFYGADICMQARAQGRKCYVINAYVEHNSSRPFKGEGLRTESYYKSREVFREKWKQYLPICTTTGIIE